MKKVFCFSIIIALAIFFMPITGICADEDNVVKINKSTDFMLWVNGHPNKDYNFPGIGLKIKANDSNTTNFTVLTNLSDKPTKIISTIPPAILISEIIGYKKGADEEYKIILDGFSSATSFKSTSLNGQVDVVFKLVLDTKYITSKHYDLFLESIRNHTHIEVIGHIFRDKDIKITRKKQNIFLYAVEFIMHPTSINGEMLY